MATDTPIAAAPLPDEISPTVDAEDAEGTAIYGTAGLAQSGGFLDEEFHPNLRGPKAAKIYRQMRDNDPIVGALMFAIEMILRQTPLPLKEADDSTAAMDAKDFVDEVISDMQYGWQGFMSEATTFLTFGYAPLEMTMKFRNGDKAEKPGDRSKFDDGYLGIKRLALRAQESVVRWDIRDDEIYGFWQQPFSGPQLYVPIEKCVLFRTTTLKNNPEGRSILRNAYRPWFMKTRMEEIEGIGAERDLGGYPVMYLPGEWYAKGASPDQKNSLASYNRMVARIKRDKSEGLTLPGTTDANGARLYELKLLSSQNTRAVDTNKIIDRYDARILASVLADFIMLGQGKTGSWALSSDKTEMFSIAIGAFLDIIVDGLNNTVLPYLWRVNGFDPETMPHFERGNIEKEDLARLAAYISALSSAGMPLFPDDMLEEKLREIAGLPSKPEDMQAGPTDGKLFPDDDNVDGKQGKQPAAKAPKAAPKKANAKAQADA